MNERDGENVEFITATKRKSVESRALSVDAEFSCRAAVPPSSEIFRLPAGGSTFVVPHLGSLLHSRRKFMSALSRAVSQYNGIKAAPARPDSGKKRQVLGTIPPQEALRHSLAGSTKQRGGYSLARSLTRQGPGRFVPRKCNPASVGRRNVNKRRVLIRRLVYAPRKRETLFIASP